MKPVMSMVIEVPCAFSPTGKHPVKIAWSSDKLYAQENNKVSGKEALTVRHLSSTCVRDESIDAAARLGGATCVEMVRFLRARITTRGRWSYGNESQDKIDAEKGDRVLEKHISSSLRMSAMLVEGIDRNEARVARQLEDAEANKPISYALLATRAANRAVIRFKNRTVTLGNVLKNLNVETIDGEHRLRLDTKVVARKGIGETYWGINEEAALRSITPALSVGNNCALCAKQDNRSHDETKGHRENVLLAVREAVRVLTFKKRFTILNKEGR